MATTAEILAGQADVPSTEETSTPDNTKAVLEAAKGNQSGATESGSPTGDTKTDTTPAQKGQEDTTGTPTGDQDGKTPTDDSEGVVEKDGEKFYKDFSKHPEWRKMKDSADALQTLLSKHGYDELSELEEALSQGESLQDLLGEQDAAKVLDAADKWEKAQQFWAEEESRKNEEDLTQEELIEKLRADNTKLKEERASTAENLQAQEHGQRLLNNFESEVEGWVDKTDLSDEGKSLLGKMLGLDNPIDDVDITDRKAVKATVGEIVTDFNKFVEGIKNQAIQDYIDGKKDLPKVPVPSEEGSKILNTKPGKVPYKPGQTPEDAFGEANKLIVERLNAAMNI